MDQKTISERKCPKCGSRDFAFRALKKIEPVPGREATIETKFRCKTCGHEWASHAPA
jgi:DNA-directed RNA polymerase subunit M/transcription elongation factor TFIIS